MAWRERPLKAMGVHVSSRIDCTKGSIFLFRFSVILGRRVTENLRFLWMAWISKPVLQIAATQPPSLCSPTGLVEEDNLVGKVASRFALHRLTSDLFPFPFLLVLRVGSKEGEERKEKVRWKGEDKKNREIRNCTLVKAHRPLDTNY